METNYTEKARQARIKILGMIHKAQTSHIASNFSVIDLATYIYENLKEGDEVVWSKGWASATIYYFLAQQGKIPQEDLEKFPNYPYLGLAEPSVNGVHVAGGSMGHGLPVAVGMALAKKMNGEKGTIYCIMSDGEMNEGTTWESAMFASQHKLDNLVVIVDKNGWQAMGKTDEVMQLMLPEIFRSFCWLAVQSNGHDFESIEDAIKVTQQLVPKVIVANTVKGKGVTMFENKLLYHYKNIDEKTYKEALRQLNEPINA